MNIVRKQIIIFIQCFIFLGGLYILKKYDDNLFLWINPNSKNIFSYLFIFLTTMMDGIIVLLTISLLYPIRKKKFLPALIALVIAGGLVYIFKEFFAVSRPAYHFSAHEITLLGRNLRNYSFPSGHAVAAMVLALYLKGPLSHSFYYLLIGIIGGLSRILVGVHFPSDIWAGCWLGYLITKLSFLIFQNNITLKKINSTLSLFYFSIIVGLGSAIGYIFFHDARYKEIDYVMIPLVLLCGIFFLFTMLKQLINKQR